MTALSDVFCDILPSYRIRELGEKIGGDKEQDGDKSN